MSHPNAGYHFALNPLETGFDANGNKIVTRLKVYLRVVAYREAPTYKERREFFSRYLVAGENSFVSTDGINYEFEGRADYDATINMSYAKDSAYCETTNTEAMGPASGGYVKLNPDTGEAEVSVQASVPARARVYSGCYSPMKYKYGNNTLNMKVTADINYEDPNPEPTPTPTPVSTATPSPNPTPTPRPSTEPCNPENRAQPKEIESLIKDYQKLKAQVDLLLSELQTYENSGQFSIQAAPNLNCPTEDSQGNGSCMSDIIALANFIAQNEEIIKGLDLEAWEKSRDAYLDLAAEVGVGAAIVLFAPGGAEIEMAIAMERMLVAYQALSPVAKAYLMSTRYGPALRATLLTVSQHADDLARGLNQIKDDTNRFLCKSDLDEMALAGGPNSPLRMYNDTVSDLHQAKPMQMAKKGNSGGVPKKNSFPPIHGKNLKDLVKKFKSVLKDLNYPPSGEGIKRYVRGTDKNGSKFNIVQDVEGNLYVRANDGSPDFPGEPIILDGKQLNVKDL